MAQQTAVSDASGVFEIPADPTAPAQPALPDNELIETWPDAESVPTEVPLSIKLATLAAVVLPFLGFVAAIVLLWGRGVTWVELSLLGLMFVVSGCGVTIGFHRLLTHRSFETYRPIRLLLAICGSMSVEGPVLEWVATHRIHHQHSDREDDPHSPQLHGRGILGVLRGFWHAHVGWLFEPHPPDMDRYVADLKRDPLMQRVNDLFVVWVALGLLIPTVLGGVITGSWVGAGLGFLWGGLVRVFIVHHVTWSINSVCHLWGQQPYKSRDHSKNNVIFGILGFGEGWHNNHHAFPTSARHGLDWWQFDISYLMIRGLEAVGLAWKLRVPDAETRAAKLRPAAP